MSETGNSLWQCQRAQCRAVSRAVELRRVATPGVVVEVCPHCGGPVAAATGTEAEVEAAPSRGPSFASALLYPFRGWGLFVLGTGTFIVGLLAFGIPFLYGYVVTILVYGYMLTYLFDVVLTTANGSDSPPGFPDFTSWWEDVLQPLLLMTSTTLLCFAPAFLYFVLYLVRCWYEGWVPEPDEPMCLIGVVGFALGSAVYYPMALLAVVMHGSRRAASPGFVIPAIIRVWGAYLAVCGFMILVGLIQVAFQLWFPRHSLGGHFIKVFLNLWAAMASLRLLGLLYRAQKEQLGWF